MSNNLEVSFYHLYTIPLAKALPLMIVKILEQNKNAVLALKDDAILTDMDSLLWTFSSKNLVPHGTKNDNFKEKQPLYLTTNTNENPNNAEYLILTPGVSFPERVKEFKKIFIFFDSNIEEELSTARRLWKKLKNDSFELKYWKQSEDGKWNKI